MLEEYGGLSRIGNSEQGVDISVTGGHFVLFKPLAILGTNVLELLSEISIMAQYLMGRER